MKILSIILFYILTLNAKGSYELQLKSCESHLFGNNDELLQIMHNKNEISHSDLAKRKQRYLKSVANSKKFNGLYLKGYGANNIDIDKTSYSLRVQWDIFDDGYLQSKKDVKKTVLKKELEYERIMDKYRRSNLELSLYKMRAISNNINYYFFKQQEKILLKIRKRAKKQYDSSLITSSKYLKRKKAYQEIKNILSYYEAMDKEKYDNSLKSLIGTIESIKFEDKKLLSHYAYQNSFELKNSKNKMALSSMDDDWIDRFKTNVFVEKKKTIYTPFSETVAGVQVQVPLDFNTKDEFKKIEMEVTNLKVESLKRLIARNINELYNKMDYHKNHIKSLKSNITILHDELKTLQIEAKYPYSKQSKDIEYKKEMSKFEISKINQEIWQERTKILMILLKLQNISGMQILPS